MALTKEQLDEVRRELAARMGGDGTYKNPRTEGAGFMGFGTKTDPLLGEARPSDNLTADNSNPSGQLAEPQDLRKTVQDNYEKSSGESELPDLPVKAASGFAPSSAATTPGTEAMDFSAPFGSTGGSMVNAGASAAPMTGADFAGSSAASTGGSGLMDFSAPFGSTGSSTVTPGTSSQGMFGDGGSLGGGWASAAGGALNGAMQGHQNYLDDPNMRSGQDGYGKHHRDYRAEVGGGFLGGVLGYYGGPVGAAVAGPAVKLAHPYAERGTREVMNFGDKVGGESGSLALDPIGTMASGKYSWGDLGKGALFGPAKKWFKF